MKKNRIFAIVFALILCAAILAGCGKSEKSNSDENNSDEKFSVVCTTFPQYDWVREIIGDHEDQYELTLLLDNGVDLHSYQPTAADIAKISDCDMFIYVGGESDGWVEDTLSETTNQNMITINMCDVLGDTLKEEEIVEGMEGEEEEKNEAEEGLEYDEHVWLSLKNAKVICKEISSSLCSFDNENAADYEANYDNYTGELTALDQSYQETVSSASVKTVLFGDRFPFRYMMEDYGLNYYAAFIGCSAETEASFETIVFLANKVDELKLSAVLVIESSDQSIAKTIISNTADKNQQILVMNSLQSVTNTDVTSGTTYLSIMKDNLAVLKKALK